MSRPKRINLAGCVFHVICRANPDGCVFVEDRDKERFLEYLTEYKEQFNMRIHAYCLMNTHFHLLIESLRSNLSEFMHRLLTAYTVWFHKKHQTYGHLFAGRFKSLVVERGEYLIVVSRYIHRNPVESSLVKKAEDYPWSSMRIYSGKAPSGFIYKKEILHWFGNKREKYIKFVQEGLDSEIKNLILAQRFLGSEYFSERINIRLKRENQPRAMSKLERKAWREEKRWKQGKIIADRFLKDICSQLSCTKKDFIKMRRKTGTFKTAMIQLIVHLRKESEWTFRHIAQYLKCSAGHVERIYYNAEKR